MSKKSTIKSKLILIFVSFVLTSSLPNSILTPGFVSRAMNDLSIVADHKGSLGNVLVEIL